MYFLGTDYIISSFLWLIGIGLFIYTIREPIRRYFQNKGDFKEFEINLKKYLKKTYPSITFEFTIIDISKDEPSEELRKNIIIDDIVDQYKKIPLDKNRYPKATNASKLWSSYTFNCEPNKDKLPSDMPQRLNALLTRENQHCFRCSKKLKISSTNFHMLVSLKKGGKYQLENLIPVCRDCKKMLNDDPSKINSLKLKDDLYDIVQGI